MQTCVAQRSAVFSFRIEWQESSSVRPFRLGPVNTVCGVWWVATCRAPGDRSQRVLTAPCGSALLASEQGGLVGLLASWLLGDCSVCKCFAFVVFRFCANVGFEGISENLRSKKKCGN